MMEEILGFDVVEYILVRLDVKDLIRCKSVCKSWYCFISTPHFVKAHLNHSYNQLGHTRIANLPQDSMLCCNLAHIVGSCNGLVCISPRDAEFVVTNPCIREERKLPTPPYMRTTADLIRNVVCWGFGYDSSTHDYKVIAGFRECFSKKQTFFYAFTLKSNVWRLIGQVKYRSMDGVDGILCGGSLYWFMSDKNNKVIISLDLSTEKFKEIPQPTDKEYQCVVYDNHELGLIEESLCVYCSCGGYLSCCRKKWVMRNNKWELYNDQREGKYEVAHRLTKKTTNDVYTIDYGSRVPTAGSYIRSSIFFKSLVSPHVNNEGPKMLNVKAMQQQRQGHEVNSKSVESGANGNIRKKKRKRYCKHNKKPFVWRKFLLIL